MIHHSISAVNLCFYQDILNPLLPYQPGSTEPKSWEIWIWQIICEVNLHLANPRQKESRQYHNILAPGLMYLGLDLE